MAHCIVAGMLQILAPSASALGRSRPLYTLSPSLPPNICCIRNRASFRQRHKSSRLISFAGKEGGGDLTPKDDPSQTDMWRSSGWLSSFHRIEEATRVFLVALFWIFLFFAASAWDGTKSGRPGKRDSKRRR